MATILLSESESFWTGMSPYIYRTEVHERSSQEVDDVINLLKPPPHAKVLDLACGHGRHALELAKRKYNITACDKYPQLFQLAKQKSTLEGLEIQWLSCDMREFSKPLFFDLVLNLFFSFGFFENFKDDQTILNNLFTSLKPGGKIIMELLGSEVLLTTFQWRGWEIFEDNTVILVERNFLHDIHWLNESYTIIENGNIAKYDCGFRLYNETGISQLLLGIGFVNIRTFGDFKGSVYDKTSQRLVVTAEKPIQSAQCLRC